MDGRKSSGKCAKLGQLSVLAFCLVLSLSLTTLLTGCTRKFYRTQADREVDHVLTEKDRYDAWKIENYHVYPDPRARFADPTKPDRPPMPPDDPAAWESAPRPQKARHVGVASVEGTGYLQALAGWNAENRGQAFLLTEVSPEDADGFQVLAKNQPFLIKLDQAVELGLFNSREYQDRREGLYLTALPVTLERFSFTAQFLATEQAIRERTGRLTPEGQHNRWRLNSSTGFTQLFSTGALLLFRFANQSVFELTGHQPKHTVSTSTALVELTQPLLRGGGKAVTLEPLTQAERNLLYEIRSYARFRKEFYVALASGGDFGRDVVGIGRFGGVTLGTSGNAPTEGYLPVLLRTAQITNERKNVAAFSKFFKRFNVMYQGGEIGKVNVDQVEAQLLAAQFTVSQRETDYRDALDRLKLQLGVPVNLLLELEDTPLQPMARQLQLFEQVFKQYDEASEAAQALEPLEVFLGTQFGRTIVIPTSPVPGPLSVLPGLYSRLLVTGILTNAVRPHLKQIATRSALVQGTKFVTEIGKRWAKWENLTEDSRFRHLQQFLQERLLLREQVSAHEDQGKPVPPALQQRLQEVEAEIDLGRLETLLHLYEARPWEKLADPARRLAEQANLRNEVTGQFVKLLGDARTERIEGVQKSWARLPSVCVNGTNLLETDLEQAQAAAAQAALINRLDLMNQRAVLVDSWRKIAVFANSLLGTLNIQYHLDSSTSAGQAKPLAFSGARTRNQLILNGELPLVRQNERNNYRASLIAYQRSRRALMLAEDSVVATVRQQVRQLRLLAENYKIQQRQVELAYAQVEQSEETLVQPATPSGQAGGPPGSGGGAGNAAALTNQLISAQRQLNGAQNQLYQIWINFQIARMQLYRDLELMPLDFRGVWNDEHASCCGTDQSGTGNQLRAPAEPGRYWETGQPERLHEPRQQPAAGAPQPR